MDKNVGIVILVILLIVLAGATWYFYSKATECKTIAEDLGSQLQACGAGLTECTTGAAECQATLVSLQEICAPYLVPAGE